MINVTKDEFNNALDNINRQLSEINSKKSRLILEDEKLVCLITYKCPNCGEEVPKGVERCGGCFIDIEWEYF